jgi:hypothetical protein
MVTHEPGSWEYDKSIEMENELADETETFVEMIERHRRENPQVVRELTEEEQYICGCLVCRLDGWKKCKAMSSQEHEARLQRFEDYAS